MIFVSIINSFNNKTTAKNSEVKFFTGKHIMMFCLQYGNTSVKLAAERGNSNAVRLLMEKGADVIIADNVSTSLLNAQFQDWTV